MSDNEEEESRADMLQHGMNWDFPSGNLSPSAIKLKSSMIPQIAKLKGTVATHMWLQKLKKDRVKLMKEGGLLNGFCYYVNVRTGGYCNLTVSENGEARKEAIAVMVSQKTGQSMTIKKHSRFKFWKKDEVQYVPAQEQG